VAGTWLATDFDIASDDCNLAFLYGLSAEGSYWWELYAADEGWTLTAANGLVADCTQTDNDIVCTNTTVFDFTEGGEVGAVVLEPTDAIVSLTNDSTASLTSDVTAVGSATWAGSCVGTECESLLAMMGVTAPCTTEVTSFNFNQQDFVPAAGTWNQAGFSWDDDGCNAAINLGYEGFPATDMDVVDNEDGTFTATIIDSGLSHECTTDGLDFSCDRALFETIALDATTSVSLSIDAAGRFGNEASYGAQYSLVVDCAGDSCDTVSTDWGVELPCASTGSTVGTLAVE